MYVFVCIVFFDRVKENEAEEDTEAECTSSVKSCDSLERRKKEEVIVCFFRKQEGNQGVCVCVCVCAI